MKMVCSWCWISLYHTKNSAVSPFMHLHVRSYRYFPLDAFAHITICPAEWDAKLFAPFLLNRPSSLLSIPRNQPYFISPERARPGEVETRDIRTLGGGIPTSIPPKLLRPLQNRLRNVTSFVFKAHARRSANPCVHAWCGTLHPTQTLPAQSSISRLVIRNSSRSKRL